MHCRLRDIHSLLCVRSFRCEGTGCARWAARISQQLRSVACMARVAARSTVPSADFFSKPLMLMKIPQLLVYRLLNLNQIPDTAVRFHCRPGSIARPLAVGPSCLVVHRTAFYVVPGPGQRSLWQLLATARDEQGDDSLLSTFAAVVEWVPAARRRSLGYCVLCV